MRLPLVLQHTTSIISYFSSRHVAMRSMYRIPSPWLISFVASAACIVICVLVLRSPQSSFTLARGEGRACVQDLKILITGTTGYLGSHLLEYLYSTNVASGACLHIHHLGDRSDRQSTTKQHLACKTLTSLCSRTQASRIFLARRAS